MPVAAAGKVRQGSVAADFAQLMLTTRGGCCKETNCPRRRTTDFATKRQRAETNYVAFDYLEHASPVTYSQ